MALRGLLCTGGTLLACARHQQCDAIDPRLFLPWRLHRGGALRSITCGETLPLRWLMGSQRIDGGLRVASLSFSPRGTKSTRAKSLHRSYGTPDLHRAHPGSLARVPNGLARQGLFRIRHSHACHRRTSSEGARQRKQEGDTAGGRLDEECCCAALPRVAAQRLHYGTRERTCKGQQNNERLHGLVQPPRARAPLAYNTAAQTALFVQNSGW